METVRSQDGATIAFDRVGNGPAVILAGGAFSYRAFPKMRELAELLSSRFTVINYDRSGRGDSGETLPYAVEREIEDLHALIEAAGGSASIWGWSSGGALALRAAAAGLEIARVAARALADVLPNAEHRTLEGQSHNPSMKAVAPVLEEFFAHGAQDTEKHSALTE